MNKVRLKFAGSLVLLLSTVGVLLAAGGQLNFLGNERPEEIDEIKVQSSGEQAKYSFYDELKKRKIEIDNASQYNAKPQEKSKKNSNDKTRYVVQVGAFSYKKDADRIRLQVKTLGYPVQISKSNKYLVQVGPFVGKTKTYQIEKQLKGQGLPTLVRRLK